MNNNEILIRLDDEDGEDFLVFYVRLNRNLYSFSYCIDDGSFNTNSNNYYVKYVKSLYNI